MHFHLPKPLHGWRDFLKEVGIIVLGVISLTLIVVSCSLLDRQIAAQERSFTSEGGFTERLYRVRKQQRDA